VQISVKSLLGTSLCSSSGSVMQLTFLLPQGDQPTIEIAASDAFVGDVEVIVDGSCSSLLSTALSVTGTREYVPCSNHGVCLNNTGKLLCPLVL
jgi:hypothetical protein